jgi:oligopeptide/dipeptide ABC transporter ATP-binding protein
MKDPKNIVEFDNLHTYFYTDNGVVKAVNGVTFGIPEGSTVGVVGESGCGKSVTSMSLMRLVQGPSGQIVDGSIRFRSTVRTPVGQEPIMTAKLDANGNEILVDGEPFMEQAYTKKDKFFFDKEGKPEMVDLTDENGNVVTDKDGNAVQVQKSERKGKPRFKNIYECKEEVFDIAKMPISEMSSIRGREIAMIFQEPMTSLNPVFTIGFQLDEVTLLHENGADKETAKKRSLEMLELVGIAMPEHVYNSYPHELSGGMRQRVMIAMALCCNPKLIIADEPTTALDVTIQAQILDLLRDVKKKISGSIMLITHDLGVIAEMVDYVVVMYAGKIVEMGTSREIFKNPMHPYTIGLQRSKPVVRKKVDRLYSIPGNVPNPINMPSHCYFKGRCGNRTEKCNGEYPKMIQVSPTHFVACYLCEGGAEK